MDEAELARWFSSTKETLERAYLLHEEPWTQSGFTGPKDRWVRVRKPIADCVTEPGTFLDIGCANGYLLECVLKWTADRGISILPYGLDVSEKLVALAKARLPEFADNIYAGNAWDWTNPRRFDYVRTELVYVPEHLQKVYVQRIIDEYLEDGGRLLACEYRNSKDPGGRPWIDVTLVGWGFRVARNVSGFDKGEELIRVAVVTK